MQRELDDHLRGIRACDGVLASLERYSARDDAIERLERAIGIDRLATALAAREMLTAPDPSTASAPNR